MPRAPYLKVYDTLLSQIKDRKMLPGIAMPGENSMAETYGVSRPTLRRALLKLADEGYIGCRSGIGWTVIANNPTSPSHRQRELVIGIDIADDDWGAFYYTPILRGMRRTVAGRGCRLQLLEHSPTESNLDSIDALALVKALPEDFNDLAKLSAGGKPVVLLNRMPPQPELGFIAVDYQAEAARAVGYLLLTGHRRIAIISEHKTSEVSNQRIAGWRQAYHEAGLSVPEELIMSPKSITEHELSRLLKEYHPSAIFVAMGCCFMSTLMALARANLRIPEDVSLFSFDDLGAASFSDTAISCVKMPLDTMGELAIDYLVRRCDEPDATPAIRRLMPASLVISDSCRKV